MTTTDMYQGMGDGKNSSRVLRPPGGGSSDIFGTGSVAHNEARGQNQANKQQNQSSSIFGGPSQGAEDQPGYKHIKRQPQPSSQTAIFGEDKSPTVNAADLKKKDKEGTYNPITGELIGPKTGQASNSSTRVLNPPGGKSSGLW